MRRRIQLQFLSCRCSAFLPGAVCALLLLPGCAAQWVTYEQQLLQEADSLFQTGNYEYAKIRYTKIRNDFGGTKAGAKAQYNLGYINVYYENPFANWEAALREFKIFAAMYPRHPDIEKVNTWIRILVVLQSFKRQYAGNTAELKKLQEELGDHKPEQSAPQSWDQSYEILLNAVRKCYVERDSLSERVRILNEVIETIETGP